MLEVTAHSTVLELEQQVMVRQSHLDASPRVMHKNNRRHENSAVALINREVETKKAAAYNHIYMHACIDHDCEH